MKNKILNLVIITISISLFLFSCENKNKSTTNYLTELKKEEKSFYVGKKIINVREMPNEKSKIVFKLNLNDKVYHINDSNYNAIDSVGWYYIRFKNKKNEEIVGWVFSELLSNYRVKSEEELEKEKYLELYSGVYVIAPVSSYSNEGYNLSSNGSATWYWIENNSIRAKYEGSWTATKNSITTIVQGKSGKLPETYIKNGGVFRSEYSSIRYLIKQ